MVDSNTTLTVEFDAMLQNASSTRWFGLRDWVVMLDMCEECPSQTFSYSISYSVSDSVAVYVRFSMPVQTYAYNLTFPAIFEVWLQGQAYTYQLEQWSNQLFVLQFDVKQQVTSIVNGQLRVACLYPTAVLTDSPETSS